MSLFKCPIVPCPSFQDGFKSKDSRDKHLQTHRRFLCTFNGCDYSILGFSSNSLLTQHLAEHASSVNEVSFPRIQRSSLQTLLKEAIDKDDFSSTNNLATEISNLPDKPVGFLLLALKKGKRKAAKAIVQALGSEIEVNHEDGWGRRAIHFVAESGDEELAKLIVELGADCTDLNARKRAQHPIIPGLNVGKRAQHPIITATVKGHIQIMRILLTKLSQKGSGSLWIALLWAAENGDVEVVRVLLDSVGELLAGNGQLYNAIKSAASQGRKSTVRLLLEKGQELNLEKQYPGTLQKIAPRGIEAMVAQIMQEFDSSIKDKGNELLLATSNGDLEEVSRLLENGVDIDYSDGVKGTALIAAASRGDLLLVMFLVEKGADLNTKSRDVWSGALQIASSLGHEGIVLLLLERELTTNAKPALIDIALYLAARAGHEGTVRLLLERGADSNAVLEYSQRAKDPWTALQIASSKGHGAVVLLLLDHEPTTDGKSASIDGALYLAAKEGHDWIVTILLERGADINAKSIFLERTKNDQNALYAAVNGGYEAVVQLLLDGGADVNTKDDYIGAVLIQASGIGSEAIVRLLLEYGADVNVEGKMGFALQRAAVYGRQTIVSLLLERGADVNASGKLGTALERAAEFGYMQLVQLLLERGADVNSNESGYTALQRAAHEGREEIVRLLLEEGADVNAKGASYTALQGAAQNGYEAVVGLLLKRGADCNAKHKSRTALKLAKQKGRNRIVNLLLEWGATDTKDDQSNAVNKAVNRDTVSLVPYFRCSIS